MRTAPTPTNAKSHLSTRHSAPNTQFKKFFQLGIRESKEGILLASRFSFSLLRNMHQLKSQNIVYHGWQIQVVQCNDGFHFHCYPPKLTDFCNDAAEYSSFQAAIAAACQFVDREIAILALLDRVADWLASGKITEDEYWNLTSFD